MRAGGVAAGLHRGWTGRTTDLDRPESKVRAHRHPWVKVDALQNNQKNSKIASNHPQSPMSTAILHLRAALRGPSEENVYVSP